jgi:hypothetical protein
MIIKKIESIMINFCKSKYDNDQYNFWKESKNNRMQIDKIIDEELRKIDNNKIIEIMEHKKLILKGFVKIL